MRRSSDSISHVTYSLVRAVLRRSAVLNPGDVLYIPRGWPHVAEAEGGAPSTHMTMTLHAQDFTWESLLRFFVLTGTGKETVFPPHRVSSKNGVVTLPRQARDECRGKSRKRPFPQGGMSAR